MRIADLGEFGLIDLVHSIGNKFKNPQHASWQQLLVGIGDDAAAWQGDNHIQLATTDTLVQDTHFDLSVITWDELGWKALAVNLSDIAAMGGIPKYALVSLALPGDLDVENISTFTHSMARLAEEFGVAIAGGNMATAPNVVITITVIGYSKGKSILKRSAASPGEQIAVTGYPGLSAAGLEMLRGKISLDAETCNILRLGHVKPMPKVKEGQILAELGIKCATDISDGLVADLGHICERSKVSARVNTKQLPIHHLVTANFPNYQQLALYGGEDYELLFTADRATIAKAKQELDCPATVIGEIIEERLPDRITLANGEGNVLPHKKGGWEHFK